MPALCQQGFKQLSSALAISIFPPHRPASMSFWGVEVKPRKPYTLEPKPGRVLHLSQATLGDGSSAEKSIVQCILRPRGSAISLCALLPNKAESCALNLEFAENDDVKFSVVGERSVFLTGFYEYRGEYGDVEGEDDDIRGFEGMSDEAEEASSDYNSEDEGDDFIVDGVKDESDDFILDDLDEDDSNDDEDESDFNMLPSSPRPRSSVVIEEIVDDEKPSNSDPDKKHHKKKKLTSSSDGNDASQMQLVVKGASTLVVVSEDEDGFPIAHPTETEGNVQNGELEGKVSKKIDEAYGDGKDSYRKKQRNNDASKLKRKSRAMEEDLQEDGKANHQSDLVEPPSETTATEKKRKKKQKLKSKRASGGGNDIVVEKSEENVCTEDKDSLPSDNVGTETALAEDQKEVKNEKKMKQKKKNKNKANDIETNGMVEEAKQNSQSSSKSKARTYGNGLAVEELSMGKPDGKRASRGSKVSVRYIGKLKKNGEIFDSNIAGKPFKFRLGIGQVIKGWDVGVEGMRIGDKRRLTIPPSMGYGSKGIGKIPPNAWLMFDVELVDVQ